MNGIVARRQSVAQSRLEMPARDTTRDGGSCFFKGICDIAPCSGLGRFLLRLARLGAVLVRRGFDIGRPAGAAAISSDSGPGLKNARQPGESWDLLRIIQAVTRSTSGISGPHRRNASPLQACCCSGV